MSIDRRKWNYESYALFGECIQKQKNSFWELVLKALFWCFVEKKFVWKFGIFLTIFIFLNIFLKLYFQLFSIFVWLFFKTTLRKQVKATKICFYEIPYFLFYGFQTWFLVNTPLCSTFYFWEGFAWPSCMRGIDLV